MVCTLLTVEALAKEDRIRQTLLARSHAYKLYVAVVLKKGALSKSLIGVSLLQLGSLDQREVILFLQNVKFENHKNGLP